MKNNYELKETFLLRLENEELVKRLRELKAEIKQLQELCQEREKEMNHLQKR